jgi:hypothetical protein
MPSIQEQVKTAPLTRESSARRIGAAFVAFLGAGSLLLNLRSRSRFRAFDLLCESIAAASAMAYFTVDSLLLLATKSDHPQH